MKADAGNNIHPRRRVSTGQKWYVRGVQLAHDIELVLDELLPYRERIGVERLEDGSLRCWPLLGDPVMARVGQVRILGVIDRIHQPLASLPEERRALPHMVGCQQLDDARLEERVVAREEHPWSLVAGQIFVFIGGTGFEDADKVLKGKLARGYRF